MSASQGRKRQWRLPGVLEAVMISEKLASHWCVGINRLMNFLQVLQQNLCLVVGQPSFSSDFQPVNATHPFQQLNLEQRYRRMTLTTRGKAQKARVGFKPQTPGLQGIRSNQWSKAIAPWPSGLCARSTGVQWQYCQLPKAAH